MAELDGSRRGPAAGSAVRDCTEARPHRGHDPRGERGPYRSHAGKGGRFPAPTASTRGKYGTAVALRRHGHTELLEASIPAGVPDRTRSIMYRGRLSFPRRRDGGAVATEVRPVPPIRRPPARCVSPAARAIEREDGACTECRRDAPYPGALPGDREGADGHRATKPGPGVVRALLLQILQSLPQGVHLPGPDALRDRPRRRRRRGIRRRPCIRAAHREPQPSVRDRAVRWCEHGDRRDSARRPSDGRTTDRARGSVALRSPRLSLREGVERDETPQVSLPRSPRGGSRLWETG